MNFRELLEGAEPKLPGAPAGISIMTPQQFVAKAGDTAKDEEVSESEEGLIEAVDQSWVQAYQALEANGGEPTADKPTLFIKQLAMLAKDANISQFGVIDFVDNYVGDYFKARSMAKLVVDAMGAAPSITAMKTYSQQSQAADTSHAQQQEITRLQHELSAQQLINQNNLETAEAEQLASMDANARLAIQAKKHELEFDAKERLHKLQMDIDANTERKEIRDHELKLAQAGYNHELSVINATAEGEYKKAKLEADYQIHIKQLDNIDNAGERQNKLDQINADKVKQIAIINAETSAKIDLMQQEVDVESQRQALEIEKSFMDEFKPIWGSLIQKASETGKTLSQNISAVMGALGRLAKPLMPKAQQMAESQEQLNRIRRLSGLGEATKLPAPQRELGGKEFQDYMGRIVGTPDIDPKTGQVRRSKDVVSKRTGEVKPGAEKYISGKTKSDRFKMPYMHRSSVITYLGPDGKTYSEEAVKNTLKKRPESLLKQNQKMKHSNGEFEQFFNIGFAALTGIAVDETTDNLIIVNTCPGAGSCKIDCFATGGPYVQFKGRWQSDGRLLTYILNDPDGFFKQLSNEITKEEQLGQAGDKKFPDGWNITIRWHDAGDFFSPEYLALALKLAEAHPKVKFYAYTKIADAALGKKPPNFIINWSEGAHTSQEKKVKEKDPNLEFTKHSRIVPASVFYDLLVKDEKKNLVKGPEGQWQVMPDQLPELKQRLAKQYGISASSILGYDEWDQKTEGGKKEVPVKYNVIIAPGEPDITANTPGVLGTLLLKH